MLKLPRQSLLLRREALTIDRFEIEIEIETDWLLRFLKRSRTAFGDLKKKRVSWRLSQFSGGWKDVEFLQVLGDFVETASFGKKLLIKLSEAVRIFTWLKSSALQISLVFQSWNMKTIFEVDKFSRFFQTFLRSFEVLVRFFEKRVLKILSFSTDSLQALTSALIIEILFKWPLKI